MKEAVFFDLFETLLTEQVPGRLSEEAFAQRLGVDLGKIRAWWKENTFVRMTGGYPSYRSALQALCQSVGSRITEGEIISISRDRETRKAQLFQGISPSILDMLEQVKGLGLHVGILSNAVPEELLTWEQCPLRSVADDAVFSCVVGKMKPQPEIYHLACERLGVSPEQSFFIGDGGFDELQAAARVGMVPVQATWYYDRAIPWDHSNGELHRVEKVEEVPTLLASWLR